MFYFLCVITLAISSQTIIFGVFARFLGYFQPTEGKPALWDLDSDYYLHVSGIGDDLFPVNW